MKLWKILGIGILVYVIAEPLLGARSKKKQKKFYVNRPGEGRAS